jgi:hypothetical protein
MGRIDQKSEKQPKRQVRDMKVKEWVDGALVLEGDILEGAEEAFRDTRYVEAFALLYADIDWWMTALIQSHEVAKTLTIEQEQKLFSDSEYRFKNSACLLKKYEIIDGKQYGRLLKFSKLRDRIIHRLVIYSYHTHAENKVTKTEAIDGFEEGKALDHLLKGKTGLVALNPKVIKEERQNENP